MTRNALNSKITLACRNGGMADAHGSGPCVSNNMWVQVPFPALSGGGFVRPPFVVSKVGA